MPVNYNFKGQGYALPYDAPGFVVLRQEVDIPGLIAGQAFGQELLDDNGNVVSLPATGFATGDILRVFKIPAGTLVTQMGINVTTVEGATAVVDVGDGDDADGWGVDTDLNATGATITSVGNAYGADNLMGKLYGSNDSLDLTFGNDDIETCIFDVWAVAAVAY